MQAGLYLKLITHPALRCCVFRLVVPQEYVGKRLLSSGCVTVQSDGYGTNISEEPAVSFLRVRKGPSTLKWGATGPLRGWNVSTKIRGTIWRHICILSTVYFSSVL